MFAVGFALGTIRTLWLVPRLGVRAAELLEMPVMVFRSFLAARGIVARMAHDESRAARLGIGLLALALPMTAEIALGVTLGRGSVAQVLFDRDPVSGPAYYLSLAIFGAMPWLLGRPSEHCRSGEAPR